VNYTLGFLFNLFILIFFYYCCTGGTMWHLQKCLQYIILEFTPSIILFSFKRSHFSIFIHESIIFLPYSPSSSLSLYPPLSHCYQPLDGTCFSFLALHFCLFKIAMQGVLLRHFHVYIYYNLNWFMPSI
jgi:hypothetical protein